MDDERPSALPLLAYAVVGVLAVIGAISIFGRVVSLAWTVVQVALVIGVLYLLVKGIGAVRSDRKRRSSADVPSRVA